MAPLVRNQEDLAAAKAADSRTAIYLKTRVRVCGRSGALTLRMGLVRCWGILRRQISFGLDPGSRRLSRALSSRLEGPMLPGPRNAAIITA